MQKIFDTINAAQTGKLGEMLAQELRGGEIICLSGELGSGKTTFAQGVLKGLGAKGPYTSPTFLVMKHYKKEITNSKTQIPNKFKISKSQFQKKYQMLDTRYQIQNIYHIDAYRVGAKDILDLGWEEIIAGRNNIVIAEWAERIRSIVPKDAVWMKFEYNKENTRKISIAKSENLKCKSKN
ncbi:MAG: tRNA (adenosine(37)-N6)-threonylcarbamoyltransferase complex ATPase subunit type 1 TsaE [Parcubacteria group bacterium]|jgi:tRNA threonylcarbamoyladenosine biosynthesis protein TsaE